MASSSTSSGATSASGADGAERELSLLETELTRPLEESDLSTGRFCLPRDRCFQYGIDAFRAPHPPPPARSGVREHYTSDTHVYVSLQLKLRFRGMAAEQGQSEAAAYKAVERVLTGAVSKILSKFGNKHGQENSRARNLQSSSSRVDNESSDSDDFQPTS